MLKKYKQLMHCDLVEKISEKKLDTNEVVGYVYLRRCTKPIGKIYRALSFFFDSFLNVWLSLCKKRIVIAVN